MEIHNNYQSQNFGNLKFAKNVTNEVKKVVYKNSSITDAARDFNVKVSTYKDSMNLEKTVLDIFEKGKLFASKLKGHMDIYTAHVKDVVSSDFTKAFEKTTKEKIDAKNLAEEVKQLEKSFKKSLRK